MSNSYSAFTSALPEALRQTGTVWLAILFGPLLANAHAQQLTNNYAEAELTRGWNEKQKCQYRVLHDTLGWRFTKSKAAAPSASPSIRPSGGNPCDKDSPSEALQKGDLTVEVDEQKKLESANSMDNLLKSKASFCAYKFKLRDAALKTADQLLANRKYEYPSDVNALFANSCSPPKQEWIDKSSRDGFCFIAKSTPSSAVQCFMSESCKTECTVGLQVAVLAEQYALYGPRDFDLAFSNSEIAIGSWDGVNTSRNPVFGSPSGPSEADFGIDEMAQAGQQMFVGMTGYFGNKYGESYLDVAHARGENLVILSMSREAGMDLKNRQLDAINADLDKAWHLFNESRVLSRLPDHGTQAASKKKEALALLDSSPFLTGTLTYSHGIQQKITLAEHAKREWQLNPRTPYGFKFYTETSNQRGGGLFDRYINYQVNRCLAVAVPPKAVKTVLHGAGGPS